MSIEALKRKDYQKNWRLEETLRQLNECLAQAGPCPLPIKKRHPILFIVGVPRSGTTLLSQWLAHLNLFCYPSNLISRFYRAPHIGALVQEMLANPELAYKNEWGLTKGISFRSDIGKTSGLLEPHEFWYYWRSHFHFPDIPVSDREFMKHADFKGFQEGIHRLQQVYQKPFFVKSLIMNCYIDSFRRNIHKPLFLFIKRDELANMRSLLKTRRKYLGSRQHWFSFKPREFASFASCDPAMQVAGQVYFTNRAIEKALRNVAETKQVRIQYEEFCRNPKSAYRSLREALQEYGCKLPGRYHGVARFAAAPAGDRFSDPVLKRAYSQVQALT